MTLTKRRVAGLAKKHNVTAGPEIGLVKFAIDLEDELYAKWKIKRLASEVSLPAEMPSQQVLEDEAARKTIAAILEVLGPYDLKARSKVAGLTLDQIFKRGL